MAASRVALAAVGVILCVASVLAWMIFRPRVDQPGRVDAVVVLGPSVSDRTRLAERLVQQTGASALVVSAHPDDLHGQQPAPCTQGAAVPVYCFDPAPATTQGEARAVRRLAAQHGWRSLAVVTFLPQVERARVLIGRCYDGTVAMVDSGEGYDVLSMYAYQSGAFVKVALSQGC